MTSKATLDKLSFNVYGGTIPVPVIDKQEKEIDFAKVADAIRKTGDIGKRLRNAGLTEEAVVLLLHDATRIGKPAIRSVLRALPKLPEWCLTKPAAKRKD